MKGYDFKPGIECSDCALCDSNKCLEATYKQNGVSGGYVKSVGGSDEN